MNFREAIVGRDPTSRDFEASELLGSRHLLRDQAVNQRGYAAILTTAIAPWALETPVEQPHTRDWQSKPR